MKNSFSKSLLCGVIASTFILVNCQKDPDGRSVKAEIGNPGEALPVDKVKLTDKVVLNLALCSKEFLIDYTELYKSVTETSVEVNKKEDVTEVRKADLLRRRSEFTEQTKKVLDDINKLKPETIPSVNSVARDQKSKEIKIDGCYSDEAKQKKYLVHEINDKINNLDMQIMKLTGVDSERTLVAKVTEEKKKAQLEKPVTYIVSNELNALLDEPFSSTSQHFVDGKIAISADFEANIKDKEKSVCFFLVTSGKLESDKLTLTSLSVIASGKDNNKNVQSFVLAQADKMYQLKCYFPETLKVEDGFAKAMGSFLTIKTLDKIEDVSTLKAEAKESLKTDVKSEEKK